MVVMVIGGGGGGVPETVEPMRGEVDNHQEDEPEQVLGVEA